MRVSVIYKAVTVKYNHVDITKEPQRIISCCTGLRGIERGLERAGIRTIPVVYLEIEAFICANLVGEMEAGLLAPAPIWTDLKTFDAKPFRGLVDGIIGGYPCPPFSNAGKRQGADDPRHLYPFISGIIKSAQPIWCLFENVEGHLSLGFKEVSEDLRSMGYSIEAGVYSAEEVGAPHRRNRLFILAIKYDWLENARNSGVQWRDDEEIDRKREIQTARSGKLANPTSEGQQESRPGNISKLQTSNGKRIYNRLKQSGITETPHGRHLMADTKGQGLEGSITEGSTSTGGCAGEYDAALTGDRWPARPGEEQYDWEEPRTISKTDFERRLGGAASRYNFREDLLRAYGNSVVEQTAEIAFIDLLGKHFKNNDISQ